MSDQTKENTCCEDCNHAGFDRTMPDYCSENNCKCHSQEKIECKPAGILLTSNPPQYRCVNCQTTWFVRDEAPICRNPSKVMPKQDEEEKEVCKRCKIGYAGVTVLNEKGLCFPCETELRKAEFDKLPPTKESWEEEFEKKFIVIDRAGRKRFITMNELSLADNIKVFIRNLHNTWKREIEKVLDYTEHKIGCILNTFSAGRPTEDGGYEQKFGNKWYEAKPIDKTPNCDCGLDAVLLLIKGKQKDNG